MPVRYIPHPIECIRNNVTGARAFGVIYQNITLRPLMVIVTMRHTVNAPGLFCMCTAIVDVVTPPIFGVAVSGAAAMVGAGVRDYYGTFTFMVAPGEYYQVNSAAGGANVNVITYWWEVNL